MRNRPPINALAIAGVACSAALLLSSCDASNADANPEAEPTEVATSEEFQLLSGRLLAGEGNTIADLPSEGLDLKEHLANVEQDMIRRALADADGVVQRAAEVLGVGRTTLVEKIKRYGLNPPDTDDA